MCIKKLVPDEKSLKKRHSEGLHFHYYLRQFFFVSSDRLLARRRFHRLDFLDRLSGHFVAVLVNYFTLHTITQRYSYTVVFQGTIAPDIMRSLQRGLYRYVFFLRDQREYSIQREASNSLRCRSCAQDMRQRHVHLCG